MAADTQAEIERVAAAILETLFVLEDEGIPLPVILASAHSEIVGAIALAFGGRVAADRCRTAAQLFAPHPSLTEAMYSAEPVAGRA